GTGQIVDANQAAADFYGYPADVLRSMLISEINVLPDEHVAQLRAQVVAGKRTTAVFPHRLASGQIRSVEVHSSPMVDRGRTLVFSIGRDVTERERVDTQLRQAAAVFDDTVEAVIITDETGAVRQVNRSFTDLTGWDFTWVVGLSAQALASSTTEVGSFDRIRDALEDGTSFRGEISIRHADATGSPALLSISPVLGARGEVTGFVWVVADIEERVAAEQDRANSEQRAAVSAAGRERIGRGTANRCRFRHPLGLAVG
ncbi:MAG: PAS domain-containing protein, partial [Actinomycetes bacterium]